MTKVADYDAQAEVMLDDGYALEDVERILGPRPVPRARRSRNGDGDAHGATRALTEGLLSDQQSGADAQARAAEASGRRGGRRAPGLRGVQLSWGGKLERIAHAMALLRGRGWHELTPSQQDGYYALAEFALLAVEKVEADEVDLTKPERIRPELSA